MTEGPLPAYRARQREGGLKHDLAQERAAERLQSLWHALREPVSWRARFGLARRPAAPRGLYICGRVGRGKSMLMDLFFAAVEDGRKRRVHFNEFMLETHDALHRWRQREGSLRDPLPRLARTIAAEARLLCFDEFRVENIADAMILGRLFQGLFDEGVAIVATSNAHPDDLYRDGLQRERFLPFIELLKRRADILQLDAQRDYRRDGLAGRPVYYAPVTAETDAALDEVFSALTGGAPAKPSRLEVMGRTLVVPAAAEGVARFPFEALCGRPLGAPDYLALAKAYHTVILSDVPLLPRTRRSEARRMVTLVDILYDNGINLVVSAAAEPDALCVEGDVAVAFQRTASRLIEMQSASYIENPPAGRI